MNPITEMAQSLAATEGDPRWASVIARDPKADGEFFYSVRTTGVYCRPSCGARLPRPENVQFYDSCEKAERAGFRPCSRCKPNKAARLEQHASKVAEACRVIETAEEPRSLKQLADVAGMSSYHFHRVFKAVTGLTPKKYATAKRAERVRKGLVSGDNVTKALYDAGYNSNGRFYERSNQDLGMTPTRYQNGGVAAEIRFAVGECSLGSILVAKSERGVCAILIGDDPDALARDLQDRFPHANLIGGDSEFEQLVATVVGFVEKPAAEFALPLDIRGTAFQQRVWQALNDIPPGSTASYSEVANRIGMPSSVRAVAQACGANPLAVAIPCHRVVRSDGGLSGYRWGVERKRALLNRESSMVAANQPKL
jgi:AraC family transcriptional regulator, regulatory protein of adaptative response / methylated-DNA-[protein]-cysteine methyltransferase